MSLTLALKQLGKFTQLKVLSVILFGTSICYKHLVIPNKSVIVTGVVSIILPPSSVQ